MACPSCHLSTPTITKHVCGSFIRVTQTCEHCEAVNVWDSQPFINNIPAGNILLSASILFSGLLPEQTLRIFQNFGCASISTRTFMNINKSIFFLLSSEHGTSNNKHSSQYYCLMTYHWS